MAKVSVGNTVLNYDKMKKAGWLTFPDLDVSALESLCQGFRLLKQGMTEVDAATAQLAYQNGKQVLIAGVININTKGQATAWARISKQGNEFSSRWAMVAPYNWESEIWNNSMGANQSTVYNRYFI